MSAGNVECLCVSLPHFYFELLCRLSAIFYPVQQVCCRRFMKLHNRKWRRTRACVWLSARVFFKAMPHPSFKKQLTYGDQLTGDTLSNRFVSTQMSKWLTSKNISVSFELRQVLIPAVKLHFCYFRDVCSDLPAVLANLTEHQRLIVMDGRHILLSMCFWQPSSGIIVPREAQSQATGWHLQKARSPWSDQNGQEEKGKSEGGMRKGGGRDGSGRVGVMG